MKTILALDPGSKTGFAYHSAYEVNPKFGGGGLVAVVSGTALFERKRGASAGMRFVLFTAWLQQILDAVEPDVVVYEMAHHRGGAATEILVGFTTRIQEECERRGIEYLGVHTGTMKKEVLGSGRAEKSDSVKFAENYLGRKVGGDDESDAVCLLAYAEKKLGEEP
jgi:Holliday junction resolvasome RuvABC endonuclease subunit